MLLTQSPHPCCFLLASFQCLAQRWILLVMDDEVRAAPCQVALPFPTATLVRTHVLVVLGQNPVTITMFPDSLLLERSETT
jgi:hypothetical protein